MKRARFSLLGAMAAVGYLAVVIASMVVDSEALPAIAQTATLALLLWAAVAAWLRRGDPAWCFGFALFGSAIYFGSEGGWNYHRLLSLWLIEWLADAIFIAAGGPERFADSAGTPAAPGPSIGEWQYYASGVHLLLSVVSGIGGGCLVRSLEARRRRRGDNPEL